MARIRIATRSSLQARTQSAAVGEALRSRDPGLEVDFVFVDTTGDQRAHEPLHSMGGQGVFVKEVQNAVLENRADLAVHSAKDLPSTELEGLVIGAFCERRDPRDVLVGRSLVDLAPGATVATGSVRRRAQLHRVRPDLVFVELRGNIPTRLEKIPSDGAIVMAAAALKVLGWTERIDEYLEIETMVPAVGQGCVAVECRLEDSATLDLLASVDHVPTRSSVERERAFLAELGSGCSLPVGAFDDGDTMFVHLSSDWSSKGGLRHHRESLRTGTPENSAELLDSVRRVARRARDEMEP